MLKKYMKHFLLMLAVVCMSIINCEYASAARYYNGDTNLIYSGAAAGSTTYIVRDSVSVEMYEPPYYTISFDTFYTHKAGGNNWGHMRYNYNWDTKAMYVADGRGNWADLTAGKIVFSYSADGACRMTGEMAFYLAYGMKFLGNQPSDFYP